MSSPVHTSISEGICSIVMDDGKVNALSLRMQADLHAAIDHAEMESAVVLLTGRSEVFSAGFDLNCLKARSPQAPAMVKGGFRLARRLMEYPHPVVIACGGHTIAMGLFLALCGDYRLGADGDFRLGANEVAIGMSLPLTAVAITQRRMSSAYIDRALLTAEMFAPQDAARAGILDQLSPADTLRQDALGVCERFKKLDKTSFTNTKRSLRSALLDEMETTLPIDDLEFEKLGEA